MLLEVYSIFLRVPLVLHIRSLRAREESAGRRGEARSEQEKMLARSSAGTESLTGYGCLRAKARIPILAPRFARGERGVPRIATAKAVATNACLIVATAFPVAPPRTPGKARASIGERAFARSLKEYRPPRMF